MCGIVGFINKEKQLDILNDMLKIQSYRGPDDTGMFFDGNSGVHLGHNRLSILDLTNAGHQPMISNCGNYVIVFNGEIYNFKDIKKELITKYNFESHSDTEVILYSYIEWGIEKALEKFRGMFAFCIYDKIKNKLILVRDRAGVKPLYYYYKDNEFLFASESKSFHKYLNFKKELNKAVLPYFFQFGYIPEPYSIFKNTFKFPAGHYMEFDLKNFEFRIKKYWDVEDFYKMEKFDKTEDEILEELEVILEDSINLRMIADVPVGVFLSGGYDSSFVSAVLSKNHKINTFTIGFNDKKYNEAEHAKEIAKHLGTNHIEYYMSEKDMINLVKDLSFYYDEPFGDSSALPTMIVSKLAKQYVKVALSADGGDEIFCGYSKYMFLNKFYNLFSNKIKKIFLILGVNILNQHIVGTINNFLPSLKRQTNIENKFLKFKRAVNSKSLEELFINASNYMSAKEIRDLLKIKAKNDIYKNFFIDYKDFLEYMMIIDYKTFLKDDVLVKVDRATMSVSLEGREPLLDHKIIEYMARVPSNLKCKNNQNKYLLRKILYKYIPSKLIDKPKSGFQIPLEKWLRNELKDLVNYYLNPSKLDKEIFNIEEIEKIKKDFFNGKNYEYIIWFILVFQMWKEKWFD